VSPITIFLDRDGVINKNPALHEYVKTVEEFEFLPRVPQAVRLLNEAGFRVVIVSNQRGIARGVISPEQLDSVNGYLRAGLDKYGAKIDGIYICPHEAGACNCRKPDIGLFLQAEADAPVDKPNSYMIGDMESDIQAGKRYGVKTILISARSDLDFGQDMSFGSLYDAAVAIVSKGAI
jgi:histidinol-phosphate phosphatase family protein